MVLAKTSAPLQKCPFRGRILLAGLSYCWPEKVHLLWDTTPVGYNCPLPTRIHLIIVATGLMLKLRKKKEVHLDLLSLSIIR